MSVFSYRYQRCLKVEGLWVWLAMVLAILTTTTPACFGQIEDDQESAAPTKKTPHGPVFIQNVEIGFSDAGRNLVRPDCFAPVKVTLSNRSGEIFTGTIQIIGRDRDGDTVIYERPGIGIKPADTADVVMSCFTRKNSGNWSSMTEDVAIRLLDKDGKLTHSQDVALDFIGENEHLIVDLSPKTVKGPIQAALQDEVKLKYRGKVRTASMRAADMPTSWYDLEAVDVIVCDQPEEARLSPDQWDTLAQWVRQGGLLVLGPGSMQSLEKTQLAKELPATVQTMARIKGEDFRGPDDRRTGGKDSQGDRKVVPQAVGIGLSSLTFDWQADVGVWQLKPRQDATSLLDLPLKGGTWPIVVRRRAGLGAIVQTAVGLGFLLSPRAIEGAEPGMPDGRIKPELFGIRTLDIKPEAYVRPDMNWGMPWPNQFSPADLIKGESDFRAAGTVLATVLLVLTIVYGFIVTLGTWLVLQRRKVTHYSWLVFGVVAVIGSVGASFLVQGARGIRAEVKQQSVVDLDATSCMASVHTYYGLRMPYDARVNVGLAGQRGEELPPEQAKEAYVRPAGDLTAESLDSFAVRRDYTVRHGQNEIEGVPVRATVKQFESYWYGPIGGSIQGSISLGSDGQLTGPSWVNNQTDMSLRECVLIYSRMPAFNPHLRNAFISVVSIGDLPAGKTRSDLDSQIDRFSSRAGLVVTERTLDKIGKSWLTKLPWNVIQQARYRGAKAEPVVVDRTDVTEVLTASMVTLLSDLPSTEQNGLAQMAAGSEYLVPFANLPRCGGRWLDLRNVLDGKTAIVIGLASKAGPTRLKVDGKAIEPLTGDCIVRAVIPLARTAGASGL